MSLLNLKSLEKSLNELNLVSDNTSKDDKLKDLKLQAEKSINSKNYDRATSLIKQMYSLSSEDPQIKDLLDKVQTLDIVNYSEWLESLLKGKLNDINQNDDKLDKAKICEELYLKSKSKNSSVLISADLLKGLVSWVWDNSSINSEKGTELSILNFLINYCTELILQSPNTYLNLSSELFPLLELDNQKEIPLKIKLNLINFYFQLLNQSIKSGEALDDSNFIQLINFILNIYSSEGGENEGADDGQALVKIASLITYEPYAKALSQQTQSINKLLEFNCLSTTNPLYGSSLLIWTKLVSHNNLPAILFPIVTNFLDKKFNGNTETSRLKGHRLLKSIFHFYQAWGLQIISQEGWLQDAIETFEVENDLIKITILDWLSLSCNDQKFRTALKPIFQEYSSPLLNSSNLNIKLNAILIQSKIHPESVNLKLVEQLTDIIQKQSNDLEITQLSNIIEIITYNSLKEDIRVYLSKLTSFWRIIYNLINEEKLNNPIIYGICTILFNLSNYPIPLTKEQRQVKQLQAMSNSKQAEASGSNKEKPKILTEEEEKIEFDRLTELTKSINLKLVNNQILDLWLNLIKNQQFNIWSTAINIMLGWATDSKLHSKLLQRGAVPALISKLPKVSGDEFVSQKLLIIQILSKLTIHTDPKLAFNQQTPWDLINLFVSILDPKSKLNIESNPLQRFESVMALTNLTSLGLEYRDKVFNLGALPNLELMMLSDHPMLRRTATECLCNLAYCQAGLDYYTKNPNKLHPLMAMTQVEDGPTRLAAGGAIASLSQLPPMRPVFLKHNKLYLMSDRLSWNSEEDPNQQELLRSIEFWYQLVEYSKQSNEDGDKSIFLKLIKDRIYQLSELSNIQPSLLSKVKIIKNYFD